MQEFESFLLKEGCSKKFVQLPTAAGQESLSRLEYWRELGYQQAKRIGVEQHFLPILTREDAFKESFASQIDGAGLIYLSGGDPHYLANTLKGSPVWEAIVRNWKTGSSLAGCSAGAMALGPDIPNFRRMKEPWSVGLNLLPNIRVIPHFNKFFRWIPDAAAQLFLKAPKGVTVAGIDEETAIWSGDLLTWEVAGRGSLHLMTSPNLGKYSQGSQVLIEPR